MLRVNARFTCEPSDRLKPPRRRATALGPPTKLATPLRVEIIMAATKYTTLSGRRNLANCAKAPYAGLSDETESFVPPQLLQSLYVPSLDGPPLAETDHFVPP